MATHSSILAWRSLWTEEPGGLQSTGSQESDTTEQISHHHSGLFALGKVSESTTIKQKNSCSQQQRVPHQNVWKDHLGCSGSWKVGSIEDTLTSNWKLGSLWRPMESIKFLVKLSAIVWTKAMDQNLVVSKVLQGAALQAVTKIHWVGKFVKVFEYVRNRKNKPVFPVLITLCWCTSISVTS